MRNKLHTAWVHDGVVAVEPAGVLRLQPRRADIQSALTFVESC